MTPAFMLDHMRKVYALIETLVQLLLTANALVISTPVMLSKRFKSTKDEELVYLT